MDVLQREIPDPSLREAAESDDDDDHATLEVIIELDVPTTAAPPGHVARAGQGRAQPTLGMAPDRDEPFDPLDRAMDELEKSLRALQPAQPPRRYKTAQAFAVTLTAPQLRKAAALPLVGVIRPSRTHKL
jgi:hypothetical protein